VKKTAITLGSVLFVLVLLVVGCAGGPRSPWTVVDHQNLQLGGDIPTWVTKSTGELENQREFEESYVFKLEAFGKDLTGAKTQANLFDVNSEVARIIETRVQQKFAGAQVGDNNLVETYFENTVKILTDARIQGLRKYGDFWIFRVNKDSGEEQYAYYSLYTIDQDRVDELIQQAIDGQEADTEEEKTAQERVREIFAEGL
jgi:hypothetical protein